jgi:glycosyltransferase involved in cell wall biosynthesis
LTLMEDELTTPFAKLRIQAEGDALRHARVIVSPSKDTLVRTIDRYGLRVNATHHIVNPVGLDSGAPMWEPQGCNRSAILFVGRFDLCKGADVMLGAFRQMLARRQELKLLFVGPDRGLPGADGRKINFREYVDVLYPSEKRANVNYLGVLSGRELLRLRTTAQVTVVPSRFETQGYTLLEAMIQGCPVVASDAGALPESIADGRNGILFKSGDPDDLASKLWTVLEDPTRAIGIGVAAKDFVSEYHAAPRIADESIKVYKKVTGA